MGCHQRFGDTRSFLLQNRNFSVMKLEVIEFCEAIAARIFRLELLLNFSKRLPIFRIYFIIPSSGPRNFCAMKYIYLSWTTSCPTFRISLYFVSFLQCLIRFVLPQWCGSKHFVTLCVFPEGSVIHAAYILSFHLEGEDRISLRKDGN
jgi:hypothetical protein